MSFMRRLVTRSSLVKRRYLPSAGYILHGDDDKNNVINKDSFVKGSSNLLQRRSFTSSFNNFSSFGGFNNGVFNQRCAEFFPSASGVSFSRHMSTTVGGESEDISVMSDVAEVISDTTAQTVASQVPAVDEIAIAAANSYFPAAEYFIDAIHSYTGLNWWSSIILATLLIRTLMIPALVNQTKSSAKLARLRPHMEEIQREIKEQGMDPIAISEGQAKVKKLYKEHGVTPFCAVKGIFIQGPVFLFFFLGISNMVEKVPSFKNGGAAWFVDLTAPDSLYIFPVLTALTMWLTVELSMQESMKANPVAGSMRNVSRIFAAMSIPLTMGFPNAIFCYWLPTNLFSVAHSLALRSPAVKKALGIPIMSEPPAGATKQPAFGLLSALKEARQARQASISERMSSSSLISQKLKRLEKEAKGRRKNKKM